MELVKDLKPLLDLGLAGLLIGAMVMFIRKPPKWIVQVVDAHHQLARGVKTMSEAIAEIPKREDLQDLLIGQEALRRENVETREEIRGVYAEIVALRSVLDGRRG